MAKDKGKRKFTENIEVAGNELVAQIKLLFDDASAKRVIIRNGDGHELLSIPLTLGVGAGIVAVVIAPVLSAVAAIGGAMAKVRLEVQRVEPPRSHSEDGQNPNPW